MTTNEQAVLVNLGVEFERNYYDDSDFYGFFLTEEGTVLCKEIGSTRYGGPVGIPSVKATPEQIEQALAYGIPELAKRLVKKSIDAIEQVISVVKGEKVAMAKDVSSTDKRTGALSEAKKGESGEVIWTGSYGRFYRGGYNQPNRNNTRVGVKFADGRVIFTSMKNVFLDRAPMTMEQALEVAKNKAKNAQFFWREALGV